MRRSILFFVVAVAAGGLAGCGGGVQFAPGQGVWSPAVTPAWAHQPRYAITDNRSDELSFVTVGKAMPQLLGNIPVGDVPVELEGPHHLASSPDGKYIYYNLSNYVPGTGSGPHGSHGTGDVPGSLVKLDAATGAKVGEVLVDRNPGDVILNAAGTLAFVTHYDLLRVQEQLTEGLPAEQGYSDVYIVDTASMTVLSQIAVGPTTHGEGLSPDEKTLYVVCAQSDELAVLDVSDPAHPSVKLKLPVGPSPGALGAPVYGPYALTVDPQDGTAWVSDNNAGDVRVFDPKTMQMDPSKVIPIGGVAMFGAFTGGGATYYVPHQGDDQLTRIDTATLKTTTLPMPDGACLNMHAIHIAPDEQSAVLVCEGDHVTMPGTVVNISLPPFAVTGFVAVGLFPDGAAWLPPAP
ncbi:MAG: hypothetical protein ACHQ17_08110 [Polyangia bacterium]|jgi:DNA-binding beta-propeller fold protein YncE